MMKMKTIRLCGPDTVTYDPPAHICGDTRGTTFQQAEAWQSRGSKQVQCGACRYYYWTPPTKPLADARP